MTTFKDYEVVQVSQTVNVTSQQRATVDAPAPQGKFAIGGGVQINALPQNITKIFVTNNAPFTEVISGNQMAVGWTVELATAEIGPISVDVDLFCICADIS